MRYNKTYFEKIEYMYQPYAWENDWYKVWEALLKEDRKKWTLRDIGDILDEHIDWEKFENKEEWDPLTDQPRAMKEGIWGMDLYWKIEDVFDGYDVQTPYIYSDPKLALWYDHKTSKKLLTAVKEVKVEDDYLDHSKETLNTE